MHGGQAGFTILETLLVITLAGIVMTIAVFGLGPSVTAARSRGGLAVVKQQMSYARELAISQQRDIKIEFLTPNQIKITRIERPSGETVISDVRLEGGVQFVKFAGLDETPDAWGGTGAIAFGTAPSIRFRSGDGALIQPDNTLVNGRVFVGIPNKPTSAGVVSVFGATGRIRSYRATGAAWHY